MKFNWRGLACLLAAYWLSILATAAEGNAESAEDTTRDSAKLIDLGSGFQAPVYLFDHWRSFIVDTGSSYTCVRAWFTNHLSQPTASGAIGKPDAESAPISFYEGPSLFIARRWLRPAYVAAVDFSTIEEFVGAEVDGIVGVDTLGHFTMRFDFEAQTLSISTNRLAKAAGDLSLEEIPGTFVFNAAAGEAAIRLTVDTGAGDYLTLNAADWEKVFPNGPARSVKSIQADFEGVIHTNLEARLPLLKIGGETYTNLICTRARMTNFSSLLGLGVLRQHRVTIDYPGRILRLERRRFDAAEANMSGLALKWTRGSAIIFHIDPGSPGLESGLAVGDEILKLDGQSIWKYSKTEIRQLLRKGEGQTLQIEALRGTKAVRARVALKRRI